MLRCAVLAGRLSIGIASKPASNIMNEISLEINARIHSQQSLDKFRGVCVADTMRSKYVHTHTQIPIFVADKILITKMYAPTNEKMSRAHCPSTNKKQEKRNIAQLDNGSDSEHYSFLFIMWCGSFIRFTASSIGIKTALPLTTIRNEFHRKSGNDEQYL